jgi:hypothetical protein
LYSALETHNLADSAAHSQEAHMELNSHIRSLGESMDHKLLISTVQAFLQHAAEEETEELPLLATHMTAEESDVCTHVM